MGGLLRDQVREVIFSAVLGRGATHTPSSARLSAPRAVQGPSGRADVPRVVRDLRRAAGASKALPWGAGGPTK